MSIEKFNTFELQLEVLSGCAYNCAGCHVDMDTGNKVTEKMYQVAEEFLEILHPYAVVIGSTDFFTAHNTMDLLRDIRFTEFLKRFDRLVINSTMIKLRPDVVEAISRLGVELQVNMVIPETRYMNERYAEVIKERVGELKETFPNVILHPQFNLSETLSVANYEALNDFYLDYFDQGVDFNLSFSRTSRDAQTYKEVIRWLREVTATTSATETGSMVGQHVDVVSPHDKLERAVIFYDNEFYAIPILYEDLIQTTEKYRFQDYRDYQRRYDQMVEAQYVFSEKTDECCECPFLATCIDHRVLEVMADYAITECVLPKATIAKVNQWQ